MVCAVHDKLNALADGAELPNDQLVPDKLIVVSYMGFKVLAPGGRIVVVGIIAHLNVGTGNDILNVADAGNVLVWTALGFGPNIVKPPYPCGFCAWIFR